MVCRGMNLDRPIDALGDGEFAYLQNVRQYKDGILVSRPGLSSVSNFPPAFASDYIHSFLTLNDVNPDTPGTTKRFIGYNESLFFSDPTFPAVPSFVDGGFSGDPLSMIGMSPISNPTPFVYVYDRFKQQKYSDSYQVGGVPFSYPIGVPQLAVYQAGPPVPVIAAGDITGTGYSWRWQLRHTPTGAKSIPGVPTFTPVDLATQQVTFADPAIHIAGTLAKDQEYTWDLYRFGGTINAWSLIGSVVNRSGLTIVDDFSDIDIASAPTLPVDDRSILYQSWLIPDTPAAGFTTSTTAAVPTSSGVGGNGSRVTDAALGFNLSWIPGTQIVIDGNAYTIARVLGTGDLFLNEDLGGNLGIVSWHVDGALQTGQPLPFVWGPFGSGQFGLYLFACGDPRSPGTVYWTNGNDPDSVSIANSLELTSSSEPLQNGCIWNGRVWVWSTERMFEMVPDLINAGQFLAQVVPGARGLAGNWCFCVGDLIYFKSRDGIFSFGGGGLPTSLTDIQLYEFLGHDGQNGFGATIPNPENFGAPVTINPPDPNRFPQQRLFWSDGVLYFDFVDTLNFPDTLLFDTHLMKGWARDVYPSQGYRAHYSELGFHTTFVADGHTLDWLTGDDDLGSPIECSIMTGADLLGDIRTSKLIGDAVVGAIPNVTLISAKILGDRNATVLASGNLVPSGVYQQTILTVNNAVINAGLNSFSQTVGLWCHWSSTERTELWDWEPSWVGKPERIIGRATDWTDDGLAGAKYLKGVIIEAAISQVATGFDLTVDLADAQLVSSASYAFQPTDVGAILSITQPVNGFVMGQATITGVVAGKAQIDHPVAPLASAGGQFTVSGSRSVIIQTDGGIDAQGITLAAIQQSEYAYFITPIIAHEMRLVPFDQKTCQIFSVRWLWDPYPEYLNIKEDFYLEQWPSVKYIRGVQIEGDTQGASVGFNIEFDGQLGPGLAIVQNGKTLTEIGFAVPFNAKEIRLIPLGHWRRHSVKWIYDNYPPFAELITAWEDCGAPGDKYMRGGVLRLETGNANVTLALKNDKGIQLTAISLTANGQREFPFVVEPPVVSHLVRWEPQPGQRWGYFRTRWDFDPYPEIYFERTPIIELGTPGAKFMQGIKLTADSGGFPASVDIIADGDIVALTLPPTVWSGKQTIPFSFPVPFIAHNLQLRPKNILRIFLPETDWVWEPAPDLASNWITQGTSYGLQGFIHHRDAYIAISEAASDITLTITMDDGIAYGYVIPATVGIMMRKKYVVLQNMKGKLAQYSAVSPTPFRLYVRDLEIKIKSWGSTGPFISMRPFGDNSFAMGARL